MQRWSRKNVAVTLGALKKRLPYLAPPVLAVILGAAAGWNDWPTGSQVGLAVSAGAATLFGLIYATKGKTGSEAFPEKTSRFGPLVSPRYSGRVREFTDLNKKLEEHGRVNLWGHAGSGKSQLASVFLASQAPERKLSWWIHASEPVSITNAYIAIAEHLKLSNQQEEAQNSVLSWLNSNDGWLLIFDDVKDPEDIAGFLPPIDSNGNVIITSQKPLDLTAASVQLRDWTSEESVQFLRNHVGGSEDDCAAVARHLHNVPLALDQAVVYMREAAVEIGQYLELLQTRTQAVLGEARAFGRTEAVETTYRLAIKAVAKESRFAVKVLRLISVLSVEEFPRWLPTEMTSIKFMSPIRFIPSPVDYRFKRQLRDPLQYNRALALLAKYSLIYLTSQNIRVHGLTSLSVRTNMSSFSLRKAVYYTGLSLNQALYRTLSSDESTTEELHRSLLPHAIALAELASTLRPPIVALHRFSQRVTWYAWLEGADLLYASARILLLRERISEAKQLAVRSLELAQLAAAPTMAFHGDGHPWAGYSVHNAMDLIAKAKSNYSDDPKDIVEARDTYGDLCKETEKARAGSPQEAFHTSALTGLLLCNFRLGDDAALEEVLARAEPFLAQLRSESPYHEELTYACQQAKQALHEESC